MRQKIRERFHIVREGKGQPGQQPGEPVPDPTMQELDAQVRDYRRRTRRRMIITAAAVILVLVGVFLFINLQTYTSVRTIDIYGAEDAGNSSYRQFGSGVLKYSRDGIVLLDRKGEEVWNQSYQMQTPTVYEFGDSAVVADKGGNDMIVVDEEGLKGEIETTLPIEKAVVSSQGIVAAILNGDSEPRIVCYDAAGNILAELDSAMTGNGYPLDIGLSENGELLMVSYMTVRGAAA